MLKVNSVWESKVTIIIQIQLSKSVTPAIVLFYFLTVPLIYIWMIFPSYVYLLKDCSNYFIANLLLEAVKIVYIGD